MTWKIWKAKDREVEWNEEEKERTTEGGGSWTTTEEEEEAEMKERKRTGVIKWSEEGGEGREGERRG